MERICFAVAATIIGIPLMLGLPKIGVYVGPQLADEEDEAMQEDEADEDGREEALNSGEVSIKL